MEADPILAKLVQIVNDQGGALPIILSVAGWLVAGVAVSTQEHMTGLGRILATGGATVAERDRLRDSFLDLFPVADPDIICLRDVTFAGVVGSTPWRAKWWRSRLSAVDGFSVVESSAEFLPRD